MNSNPVTEAGCSSTITVDENEINPNFYEIVVDNNNCCITDNNKILLQRKADQQLVYIDQVIVFRNFRMETQASLVPQTGLCEEAEMGNYSRTAWTKNEIIELIHLYKGHEKLLKSSTVKNEKVWQLISEKLQSHSAEQCKNKFKYLKSKYVEKKDNMSSRRTGEKNVKFEYFNEFDEIFSQQHNIQPIAIACSSKGNENIVVEEEEKDCRGNVKKKKRSLLEKQLMEYQTECKSREEARAQRHQENLSRQDRALEILEQVSATFKQLVEKK